jgi:putative lipoic acid-binding regulatory protein
VEVVIKHDPTFHEGKLEVRPSAQGNYTGLTVIVRAISRPQLDALYTELSGHPMVKIVM